MALECGVENGQLAQSIDELRILGNRVLNTDRGVEATKHLLECVVVAFAVSAGKIGVAARRRLQQRWILHIDLIGRIAMAGPKFIGTLLVPRNRRARTVDFNAEPVLASG